jgi:excisionase family DNA binding protein
MLQERYLPSLKHMPKTAQNTIHLNVSQAAKILGVSPTTLRRLEKSGEIKAHRLENGYRVFNKQDITELKIKSTNPPFKEAAVYTKPKTAQVKKKHGFYYQTSAIAVTLILMFLSNLHLIPEIYKPAEKLNALGYDLRKILGYSTKATNNNVGQVLQASDINREFTFNVNVPANFRDQIAFENIDAETETYLETTLDISGEVLGTGLTDVVIADGVIDGNNLVADFSYDGTLDVSGTLNISGTWELDSEEITATADEINSIGTITDEIAVLDGITSTSGGIYFSNGSTLMRFRIFSHPVRDLHQHI